MAEYVLYSGYFVDNPDELTAALPPRVYPEGVVYAHHVTQAFEPAPDTLRIMPGRKRTVLAIGQVMTEDLHAVLVRPADDDPHFCNNRYPHITMSTAPGVHPKFSNDVLAEADRNGDITPIEPPVAIAVTEGWHDGEQVHLG